MLAIEKRATGWYFYKAASQDLGQGRDQGQGLERAKAAVVDPTATGRLVGPARRA